MEQIKKLLKKRRITLYHLLGDEDTIELLIQNGAKVAIASKDGKTALDLANEKGNLQ